jgi:type VI secretion system protein ImpK
MSESGDSFHLIFFREFYAEVIRLKREVGADVWAAVPARTSADADAGRVEPGTWTYIAHPAPAGAANGNGAEDVIDTSPVPPEGEPALTLVEWSGNRAVKGFSEQYYSPESARVGSVVWHRLLALFKSQALGALRYGESYAAEYQKALYVMVALADEIFLRTEWEGQAAWGWNLLESKVFRSHDAGQRLFEQLDNMLRVQNPADRDLAEVYLMALSLGFQGKYDDSRDGMRRLADYRKRLFIFIRGREPELNDELRYLFPEAYTHVVREEGQRKLSDPRAWIVVLGLVIIVYTVATQLFWLQLTRDLNTVNQSISATIGHLRARP